MERIDILKRLVELYENGQEEAVEKILLDISHNDLKSIARIFDALASCAKDAPTKK